MEVSVSHDDGGTWKYNRKQMVKMALIHEDKKKDRQFVTSEFDEMTKFNSFPIQTDLHKLLNFNFNHLYFPSRNLTEEKAILTTILTIDKIMTLVYTCTLCKAIDFQPLWNG